MVKRSKRGKLQKTGVTGAKGGAQPKRKGSTVSATAPIEQPTPEQASRVEYQRMPVRSEMGQTIGLSYRRRPLFETMADKGGIAPNELAALRYYRTAFDRCERSPTKSCLNVGVGGSSRNAFNDLASATESILDARRRVSMCERVLGRSLATMRGLVLHDRSISDLAIERFGGRRQDWIEVTEPILKPDGKQLVIKDVGPQWRTFHREKLVPRSGRHREIVRQEFLAGIRALTRQLAAANNMRGVTEIWIEPLERGATLVIGPCAPARRYRLWGSYDDVAEVRFLVEKEHPRGHVYPSAEQARVVLDDANEKSRRPLLRLDEEELAA